MMINYALNHYVNIKLGNAICCIEFASDTFECKMLYISYVKKEMNSSIYHARYRIVVKYYHWFIRNPQKFVHLFAQKTFL